MALVQEYLKLTADYQTQYGEETVLLMQVGSFMEIYGPGTKIHEICRICGLNITFKNGKGGTLLAGFHKNGLDKYLQQIQEAGYTAVVYTEHPDKPSDRNLFCIVSPGTFFYTEPHAEQITNNIMCVWISTLYSRLLRKNMCHVGVANVDIFTGNTFVFQYEIEYATNSPPVFDQLERIVSIYHPLETIVLSNLSEAELTTILQYSGIHSKKVHLVNEDSSQAAQNCSKQVYQKELFVKFYGEEHLDLLMNDIYQNNMASQTLCYLLNFIHQHNPSLLHKIKLPVFDNHFSNRLMLANHSLKQLNLIDDGSFQGKHSSLCKLLNECCTPMGKRAFESQLLTPITDAVQLQAKYDLIAHVLEHYTTEQLMAWTVQLSRLCDLSKCIRQLHMFHISPKTLFALHQSALVMAEIYDSVKTDALLFPPPAENDPPLTVSLDTLLVRIGTYLDLDLCKDISATRGFDINFFRRGMYPVLDALVDRLEACKRKIEFFQTIFDDVLENAEAKKGAKQAAKAAKTEFIKLEMNERSPPTLCCTKKRFETLKSKLHVKNTTASCYSLAETLAEAAEAAAEPHPYRVEISRDNVSSIAGRSSHVVIYHEELWRVCDEYFETNEEIKRTVNMLYLQTYLVMLEGITPEIEQLERFVTDLDVVCCKALLARKYHYCRPQVCQEAPKAFVRATELRHPIIELLQENEAYVPNDVTLGSEEEPDGILLYGVNMAGKTSLIRALGMSVIMAQAGLYVPATSFEFQPYHFLFTRILGNDNLFKGLSTFAVEMVELKSILSLSNPDSLVLGDEVCSGTETVSACSIFVSALQQLTQNKASYVFATHLHEIVDFEEIVDLTRKTLSIKHMDVRYDATRGALIFNRRLLEGSGSKMYGLEVCKSLHMPRAFLDQANAIRLKYFATLENDSLLEQRISAYNAKKVVGLCEQCQLKQGTEVHHIAQQKDADAFGYVVLKNGKRIHKNNLQNLLTVCEKCHKQIHGKEVEGGSSGGARGGKRIKKTI